LLLFEADSGAKPIDPTLHAYAVRFRRSYLNDLKILSSRVGDADKAAVFYGALINPSPPGH
jgi:hypothetical protein